THLNRMISKATCSNLHKILHQILMISIIKESLSTLTIENKVTPLKIGIKTITNTLMMNHKNFLTKTTNQVINKETTKTSHSINHIIISNINKDSISNIKVESPLSIMNIFRSKNTTNKT